MTIRSLSASQAEEFDPEQTGGCPRRWYLHRVERLPVPQSGAAQEDGNAGHAHFAHYYRTGERPRRAKMAKAVNGALDAGRLPAREPGQLIESRFDGQHKNDPLDETKTLWLGGVPWDGYVDLRFERRGVVTVLDHKFSSDIHAFAKSDLLATVQMPVYALDSLRIWPNAEQVLLLHHYVSRRGVDSFIRQQWVSRTALESRAQQIVGLVKRMQEIASATSAEDVPGNRKSCHTWSGCPFQSRCSVFKEKPRMNLNAEELEWLKMVGGGAPAAREADEAARIDAGKPQTVPAPEEEPLVENAVQALTTDAAARGTLLDDDPFAVFEPPKPSVPQEQPRPVCAACGTEMNTENGSQRDGKWTHVGCPADTVAEVETFAPGAVTRSSATGGAAKCPSCPHAAHPGAACTGKRGRGRCLCGAAAPTPGERSDAAALAAERAKPPTAWKLGALAEPGEFAEELARDDGHRESPESTGEADQPIGDETSVSLARERDMHRRTLGELDASERERNAMRKELDRLRNLEHRVGGAGLSPAAGWAGTLRVEVNLGPETLALFTRLLGGR